MKPCARLAILKPDMFTVFSIFLLLTCQVITASDFHPLSDDFIDGINNQGVWRAGRNFHPDTPLADIRRLLGTKLEDPAFQVITSIEHDPEVIKTLPDSFDPREKWLNCPSLKEIRDQGSCGSCWAFGAVEAMTDRVCIYSNGTKNFHFSAEETVACVGTDGCEGSFYVYAWEAWVQEGLVSGGNYGSKEGCRPYSIPPCEHSGSKGNLPDCTPGVPTPACERKCQEGYKVPYKQDKKRGKRYYAIRGEKNIQAELFQNGPVEVGFEVYPDFLHYKGGVYQHLDNYERLGGHAVKMMGWGEENGKKYWLIANSWNSHWGDKGYFKIRRGVNECGIEENVIGGEPALDDD